VAGLSEVSRGCYGSEVVEIGQGRRTEHAETLPSTSKGEIECSTSESI
jgi:hypothetical protein